MIRSSAFDYINTLQTAADASWRRNEVIGNNIANIDTPGYKRQDIDFEKELKTALRNSQYVSMDAKVHHLRESNLKIRTYTDYAGFSYRMDGNNVDVDTENVMLAKNHLKYNGLATCIQAEFQNLRAVMQSGG